MLETNKINFEIESHYILDYRILTKWQDYLLVHEMLSVSSWYPDWQIHSYEPEIFSHAYEQLTPTFVKQKSAAVPGSGN